MGTFSHYCFFSCLSCLRYIFELLRQRSRKLILMGMDVLSSFPVNRQGSYLLPIKYRVRLSESLRYNAFPWTVMNFPRNTSHAIWFYSDGKRFVCFCNETKSTWYDHRNGEKRGESSCKRILWTYGINSSGRRKSHSASKAELDCGIFFRSPTCENRRHTSLPRSTLFSLAYLECNRSKMKNTHRTYIWILSLWMRCLDG